VCKIKLKTMRAAFIPLLKVWVSCRRSL
jgi:hypothetical protein